MNWNAILGTDSLKIDSLILENVAGIDLIKSWPLIWQVVDGVRKLPYVNSPGCCWLYNVVICQAVMTTWTRISKKCFEHLTESIPWGNEAVVRARRVLSSIRKVFLIKCPDPLLTMFFLPFCLFYLNYVHKSNSFWSTQTNSSGTNIHAMVHTSDWCKH